MAVTSTQVTVSNTATKLVDAPVPVEDAHSYSETASANLRYVLVTNGSGTTVFLGGPTVTASGAAGGVQIGVNTTLNNLIPLRPSESLYAITASSTSTVTVLVTGN